MVAMKLKTKLTHFNDKIAICQASLEEGTISICVYASAHHHEADNYPDLAQRRALQLVQHLWKKGIETLPALEASITPSERVSPLAQRESATILRVSDTTSSGEEPLSQSSITETPPSAGLPW